SSYVNTAYMDDCVDIPRSMRRIALFSIVQSLTGGSGRRIVLRGVFGQRGSPGRSNPIRLNHLLVVIPGIGGSELLARDGTPVWSYSMATDGELVWKAIRSPELLAPTAGALEAADYQDGVYASRLLAIPIPGLTRMLGSYEGLRREIAKRFDV